MNSLNRWFTNAGAAKAEAGGSTRRRTGAGRLTDAGGTMITAPLNRLARRVYRSNQPTDDHQPKGESEMKTRLFKGAIVAMALGLGLTAPAVADQLADIKANGKIVVATEMHFPPFDLLADGEFQGIDRELVNGVAKSLGVQVEYLDLPWDSILPGLEANKFDLVIAPVTMTAERAKRYAFTLPIGDATYLSGRMKRKPSVHVST